MTCIEARQRWQRRLDLGGSDVVLDGHLAACEKCRTYAASMERLVGLMNELREDTESLTSVAFDPHPTSPLKGRGVIETRPSLRRHEWTTPSARGLLRIAATLVIVIGAGLWFRTPKGLMVENRTTEAAAPAVQGITLQAQSRERFIAVAVPSAEPNVQTFWFFPSVTVTESHDRS